METSLGVFSFVSSKLAALALELLLEVIKSQLITAIKSKHLSQVGVNSFAVELAEFIN